MCFLQKRVNTQHRRENALFLVMEMLTMTDDTKRQLSVLKQQGMSYGQISKTLGIPLGSVKSYLSRHKKNGEPTYCKSCGKRLKQTKGHRQKKFCNDNCRQHWWKHHQDDLDRRSFYNFTCVWCGKSFTAYGNRKRKYCCRACYLAARGQKEKG